MLNTRKQIFYTLFYYVHTIIHMALLTHLLHASYNAHNSAQQQVGYGGDPSRARCREASDARASRYREFRVYIYYYS